MVRFLITAWTATLIASCAPIATTAHEAAPAVAVGFTPSADGHTAEALVLEAIGSARSSIQLAAYSFTSKDVAAELIAAHRRGVDMRVVLDKSNRSGKYSGATFLANSGVPVRISTRYAIMHNKFIIIDDAAVQTGSFNYTKAAAERNAENAIWIRNSPGLAAQYKSEWARLWAEASKFEQGVPSR